MHLNRALIAAAALAVSFTVAAHADGANHLAGAHSAYLQRAIGQPVDWYPYGPAAFALARQLNRPILLDVGATWCPWCVRMDQESYARPEVADYINQHFVAVKVDYDAAGPLVAQFEKAQAYLNLPAGLPLVSFLTPDGRLYDGNGYLSNQPSKDKPSLRQALDQALLHSKDPQYLKKNSYAIHDQDHSRSTQKGSKKL